MLPPPFRWLAFLLPFPILAIGCASGTPSFVKFSPDSRRVVYQDLRYSRVYFYDVVERKQHVFPGSLTYVDHAMEHFMVVPTFVPSSLCDLRVQDIDPLLIDVSTQPPSQQRLPRISPGFLVSQVYFELDASIGQWSACVYGRGTRQHLENEQALLLWRPSQSSWTAVDFPPHPFALFDDLARNGPCGVRDSGPVYCPTDFPKRSLTSEDHMGLGIQTRAIWTKGPHPNCTHIMCMLSSPDGRFTVRVGDTDDPGKRLTLTEEATGAKTILLDKNDVPDEFLTIARVPFLPFEALLLWLVGPI